MGMKLYPEWKKLYQRFLELLLIVKELQGVTREFFTKCMELYSFWKELYRKLMEFPEKAFREVPPR